MRKFLILSTLFVCKVSFAGNIELYMDQDPHQGEIFVAIMPSQYEITAPSKYFSVTCLHDKNAILIRMNEGSSSSNSSAQSFVQDHISLENRTSPEKHILVTFPNGKILCIPDSLTVKITEDGQAIIIEEQIEADKPRKRILSQTDFEDEHPPKKQKISRSTIVKKLKECLLYLQHPNKILEESQSVLSEEDLENYANESFSTDIIDIMIKDAARLALAFLHNRHQSELSKIDPLSADKKAEDYFTLLSRKSPIAECKYMAMYNLACMHYEGRSELKKTNQILADIKAEFLLKNVSQQDDCPDQKYDAMYVLAKMHLDRRSKCSYTDKAKAKNEAIALLKIVATNGKDSTKKKALEQLQSLPSEKKKEDVPRILKDPQSAYVLKKVFECIRDAERENGASS
jgi:hypothetical protein